MNTKHACCCIVMIAGATVARGEKYTLVTGVDARQWPGVARSVAPSPGPGIPGTFQDGDRLAGTSDVGSTVNYVGLGTPMFQPNEFGSTSFLIHRGTVPIPYTGQMPLMGVDFLGGPRLDLDGDLGNAERSLIPVPGQTPALMTDQDSFVELRFDIAAGEVGLINIDAVGNNEGSPQIQPETATILASLAGTAPDATRGPAINPEVDSRLGALTPFTGAGALAGVYRIEDLGYEFWYDSIDPTSGTANELGTFQFLGIFNGWMVKRDEDTGEFPTLAGQGLGSTAWPFVDDQYVDQTYVTANGLSGGFATISAGHAQDQFDAAGNGGEALTDFAGDLGAYFDNVVVPALPAGARRFVYLEGAGCGVHNANDPVFIDSIGYDVVLIGADESCAGDINLDGVVDLSDLAELLARYGAVSTDASYNSDADFDGDGQVNLNDLAELLARYGDVCS